MTTPDLEAQMPKNVRLSAVGVLGPIRGGGVSVLSGITFALAVLRGFSSAEARNWFDQ